MILQDTEGGTRILAVMQFKHAVYQNVRGIPFQPVDRQGFKQLIESGQGGDGDQDDRLQPSRPDKGKCSIHQLAGSLLLLVHCMNIPSQADICRDNGRTAARTGRRGRPDAGITFSV